MPVRGGRDTIRVHVRLRPAVPEDECASPSPEKEATFLTPGGGETSCFQAFNPGTGECVYQRADVAGAGGDGGGDGKRFSFDGLFDDNACQREVYDGVAASIVEGCLEGYNGALLAYGQTGSGKTFSMRGAEQAVWPDTEVGLIPRALAQLLAERERLRREQKVEITLTASYVQIYCEMLQDLLDPSNTNLSVREKGDGRVFVEGLSAVPVTSLNQCLDLIRDGDQNRTTSATRMNATSSRSHAAFIVHVERREPTHGIPEGVLVSSTLTMVDLAGSERVKKSGVQYQQLEESKAINLSLSALGNCVSALAHGRAHIPYRDSKLTRLLCQSLGGNARTALLVAVAPGGDGDGETLSSLMFAQRASRVQVSAVRNETVDYSKLYASTQAALDRKDDRIHALELELAQHKQQLAATQGERDRAVEEKLAAEAKLARAASNYESSVDALQKAADDPGGERAIAAIETVNDKWRRELDGLQREHDELTAAATARWERQLAAYKAAASDAAQQNGEAEAELTHEREDHLEALTKYRETRERLAASENESAARIAELLAELSAQQQQEKELHEALEAARRTADMSMTKADDMASRLESLESQHSTQSDIISQDYVSREQVAAMESLFKETVERLATRLELLEEQNQELVQHTKMDRNRMDAQSRRLLEQMEQAQYAGGGGGGGGGGGTVRRGVRVDGSKGAARGVRIEPGKLRAGGAGPGRSNAGPARSNAGGAAERRRY